MRASIKKFAKSVVGQVRHNQRPLLVIVCFAALVSYSSYSAFSYPFGIPGVTQKAGNSNSGCVCHSLTANPQTIVRILPPYGITSYTPGATYQFSVSVLNFSGEVDAGVDVAASAGLLDTVSIETDAHIDGDDELVHSSPKQLKDGSATWKFKYTAPTDKAFDTLFAAGNAVNGDGENDTDDHWNFAPDLVISFGTNNVETPRELASLNNLRVWPNPSHLGTMATFESVVSLRGYAEVCDVSGKPMLRTNSQNFIVGSNMIGVSTSILPNGPYFLRLLDVNDIVLAETKLVVRHN